MRTGNGRLLGWLVDRRRGLALVMTIAMAAMVLGCYGKFPVTHAIYDLNGGFENRFVESLVFWVFIIVPVYEVATLGDALIFNVIEFWTGEEFDARAPLPDGVKVVVDPAEDGREAMMTIERDGRLVGRLKVVKTEDGGCELRSPDGKLYGSAVRTEGGEIGLLDATGRTVARVPALEAAGL